MGRGKPFNRQAVSGHLLAVRLPLQTSVGGRELAVLPIWTFALFGPGPAAADGDLSLFVADWGSTDQVNRLYRNTAWTT